LEFALDVEVVHAMAPNANIVLVEANTNRDTDFLAAILVGNQILAQAGGGEMSMSWGDMEYEWWNVTDATYFTTPGVVYFASFGDSSTTQWPCDTGVQKV
jgi:subtilase family serine protease